jgi:hypothetical protein
MNTIQTQVYDYVCVPLTTYTSGYRFTNVQIPKSATIISATFSGYVYGTFNQINATIYGDKEPNVLTFNATNGFPPSKTFTSSSVFWSNHAATYPAFNNSPDISAIVQEIVNQSGWAPGNAMAILTYAPIPTTYYGTFYSYRQSSSVAAKLSITYQHV